MKIINLTQHPATPEQIAQGVVDPDSSDYVRSLLTFSSLPDSLTINSKAVALAALAQQASGATHAMIGGAPYLIAPLERALLDAGIMPLYAFSNRVSVEAVQPDGSVVKTATFKHIGFVEAVR